ncbi:MAG: UvrD-helicase domain-containing protein [Thermoanaerobaculia bacterium]
MAMAKRQPKDLKERKQIAENLDVTMMVEAAAGTGKTTSLVTRMVALVKTGRYRAPELAAITFTRKAGAQLREKFQEALEKEAIATGSDEVLRALGELDRTFLGTTHAFCGRLLRERPVEAGLEPEFRELDEQEARLHSSRFWQQWWEARVAEDDPRLVKARRIGIRAMNLQDGFRSVVGNADVELVWQDRPQPDLSAACKALSDKVDEVYPLLPPIREELEDKFGAMIREVRATRESADLDEISGQVSFLREAKDIKATLNRWDAKDKALAVEIRDSWLEFMGDVVTPAMTLWKEYVHGVAMAILVPAAEAYAKERKREGVVTFDDLMLRTRDLLRDHSGVRRYFQARYRVILVDEFQDTDPLQAEILFYLTGEDTEERSWRKLVPRAGSLFIVGDPKQSIYRFRRADITTYLEVRKLIEESGGAIVPLSTNFRSTPAICTFVNESFPRLFTKDDVEAGRQAEHVDLTAFREDETGGVFAAITAPVGKVSNEEVAAAEAGNVAARIRVMVEEGAPVVEQEGERPAKWGDFLLISWNRPRLGFYAEALEREGIPYEITGGRAFQASEELAALLPPLHAILEPDDRIPLVAFLRGRFCGVDDDALYRFRRMGGRFSIWSELPEETDPRIATGMKILRETAEESNTLPAAAVIGRLVDRLGLMALAAAAERGETRSGNLALALSYARHDSAGGAPLSEVVDVLEALLEESSEIEEMNIEPAARNAVRLMNLHQVKGLEAPFVFLVDPTRGRDFDANIVVQRGEENIGHLPIRWKPWPGAQRADLHGQPVDWDSHESGEKLFLQAERKRLLYVAATRAQQWLAIGLRRVKNKLQGSWEDLGGDHIANLEPPRVTDGASAEAPVSLDFEAGKREIEAARARSMAASYSVLPITKIAHKDQERVVRAEEGLGKGTSWGRVMHRLFEALLRNPSADVALLAENLLKDEERDAAERDEVLRTVAAVTSSPLWQRVLGADERHAEVPFAIEVPAAELGIEGPETTLLHGTVDLVFREGAVWHIVDYKTDATADRLEVLVAYYRPQVEHYAKFWQKLTGAETRAGLFFVDGCREEWV